MHEKYSYRIIWSEDDKQFVGLCMEFPSLSWLSNSHEAALKGIRKLVREVIEDMHANDEKIPEPVATKRFSGKFMVRVPPGIHRQLVLAAMEAKISLNRYVSAMLAANCYSNL